MNLQQLHQHATGGRCCGHTPNDDIDTMQIYDHELCMTVLNYNAIQYTNDTCRIGSRGGSSSDGGDIVHSSRCWMIDLHISSRYHRISIAIITNSILLSSNSRIQWLKYQPEGQSNLLQYWCWRAQRYGHLMEDNNQYNLPCMCHICMHACTHICIILQEQH